MSVTQEATAKNSALQLQDFALAAGTRDWEIVSFESALGLL